MKLKEKLADDFYKSKYGQDLNGMGWDEVTRIIYIAGFEKAREMAAKELLYLPVYSMEHQQHIFRTGNNILKLGEEEVDET